MPSLNFDEDRADLPHGQWHRAFSGLGASILVLIIVIVIFAVAYRILHHDSRTKLFQASDQTSGIPGQAKPSPAIPFGAKPKVAPPPVLVPLPADSVPAAVTDAVVPGAPPVTVKAKDAEGVYQAKHQKSFGRGCDGRLELSHAGLDFTCSSGSEAPLHFAVADIKGPNGNGIELKTGEKFHFDLRRSKAEEQEIFRDWSYTHVPGAYAARN